MSSLMPLMLICYDYLTIFYLTILPVTKLCELYLLNYLVPTNQNTFTLVKRVFIIILDFFKFLTLKPRRITDVVKGCVTIPELLIGKKKPNLIRGMIFRKHIIYISFNEIRNFYRNSCYLVNKTMRATDAKINLKHLADF